MGTPAAGAAHSPLRLSAPRLCPGLAAGPLPGPSRPLPPHTAGAGPALALTAPDSAARGACRRWALLIPARGLAGRPGAERGWGLSETCPSEYLLSSVSRNYLEVLLWLISPSFFFFFPFPFILFLELDESPGLTDPLTLVCFLS